MPLIHSKSKQALKKNIETEMESNPDKKDRAQNLAIAYSVQRQARKRKKMADGGPVASPTPNPTIDSKKLAAISKAAGFADGGEVTAGKLNLSERVLAKRRMNRPGMVDESYEMDNERIEDYMSSNEMGKRMAEGGMVDLDQESEEHPNDYYRQNQLAAKKEQYDDSQLSHDPMDSNEHGDSIDSDLHDMVSKIRSKIKHRLGR